MTEEFPSCLPSLQRDTVQIHGLVRRADLNGSYGLIQKKRGPDAYEVRVGKTSFLVKMANLDFPAGNYLVFNADGIAGVGDMTKHGLVLDTEIQEKYLKEDKDNNT